MKIFIEYCGNELYIEEYEEEWGTRFRAYSGEKSEVQFSRRYYVDYKPLIDEWKKLVDKVAKSKDKINGNFNCWVRSD